MKVGFIGLGNMGSALAAGLLESGAVLPRQVVLFNRSRNKAEALAARFPGTSVAEGAKELAEMCDLIFISVRADQVHAVLRTISPLRHGQHLVVVNGGHPLARLEALCAGAVSKLIPSITMEFGRGVSLLCHGAEVAHPQRLVLENTLTKASKVNIVPEEMLEVAADLTSCGPALMAEMMFQFSATGVRHGLDADEAWNMVLETLRGTVLAFDHGLTVEELKERVATKGGITEQGLKVLQDQLPKVFDSMMEATLLKHAAVKGKLKEQMDV